MAKTSIYSFAKYCMQDEEFNKGGIPQKERYYFDQLGMKYAVDKDGCVIAESKDISDFYVAMATLYRLNKKYS